MHGAGVAQLVAQRTCNASVASSSLVSSSFSPAGTSAFLLGILVLHLARVDSCRLTLNPSLINPRLTQPCSGVLDSSASRRECDAGESLLLPECNFGEIHKKVLFDCCSTP